MFSKEEKIIRLLQYLKKFTDVDNPTSMPLIDYYFEKKGVPDLFGPPSSRRKTKRTLIKELIRVLNTDLHGNPLPREEWQLVYDGYGEENDKDREYICNLYYVQPFNKYDIDELIKCVESNSELEKEKKDALILKIRKHLSNKNYNSRDLCGRIGLDPIQKKRRLTGYKRVSEYDYSWQIKRKPEYEDW